jgi:erythromycin esterase
MKPNLLSLCPMVLALALSNHQSRAAEPALSYNALEQPAAEREASSRAAVLEWMRRNAKGFAAATPTELELEPLLASIGAPTVLGIGEISHGTHEDLAFKSALILALVKRGAVQQVFFELNRHTGERLDRFVARGSLETDAGKAMREAKVYAVWMTHELADLLDELRRFNATASAPVRVVGVDVQDSSRDLDFALSRLERLDAERARRLRAALHDWLSTESMQRHALATAQTLDRARWQRGHAAALELESALRGRDVAGYDAANAARLGVETWEYDVPGMAKTPYDVPAEVWARRDVAMADRLLTALPKGQRAVLWAHDGHVSRVGAPYGLGLITIGARLHHRLGSGYRVITFSAGTLDFHAKSVSADIQASRAVPFRVWRYESSARDFGHFLGAIDLPHFWLDMKALPQDEAGSVFRELCYAFPGFGWGIPETTYQFSCRPVGYDRDVIVHFRSMTPSRRLR